MESFKIWTLLLFVASTFLLSIKHSSSMTIGGDAGGGPWWEPVLTGLARQSSSSEASARQQLQALNIRLELNPADYSAWRLRREALLRLLLVQAHSTTGKEAAGVSVPESTQRKGAVAYRRGRVRLGGADGVGVVEEELAWAARAIARSPKGFQVWFHRRLMVDLRLAMEEEDSTGAKGVLQGELEWVRECCLEGGGAEGDQAKNHHAWTYRLWLVMKLLGGGAAAERHPPPEPEDGEGRSTGGGGGGGRRAGSSRRRRRKDKGEEEEEEVLLARELQWVSTRVLVGGGDPANNSAWSYRAAIGDLRRRRRQRRRLHSSNHSSYPRPGLSPPPPSSSSSVTQEEEEAALPMALLRHEADNEAAWEYLRGIARVGSSSSSSRWTTRPTPPTGHHHHHHQRIAAFCKILLLLSPDRQYHHHHKSSSSGRGSAGKEEGEERRGDEGHQWWGWRRAARELIDDINTQQQEEEEAR